MLEHIKTGSEICIGVTLVDGIVLARSAFHHSINYKSVVIFGKAEEINDPIEKTKALKIITEHIIKGRWDDARKPNKKELKATSVFSLKLNEVSAKVREGGPVDEKEDMDLNVWAGVLPLGIKVDKAIPDTILDKNVSIPEYLLNYRKPQS
jgi:nitroimidazol reductase NimA-like FMN-containing flavoprotein (pyridoxamine 5'-phosphate oxidase superfamily)